MEASRAAADGTTYNNGYGICFISKTWVSLATWNNGDTLNGAYKSSTMHTTHLPGIVAKLQNVLGSHIVQRNVLLSSSVDVNIHSNGYTWTKAYATLMSVGQMTGKFAANGNKYDDGEANYKLPIFNHKEYKIGNQFWTRGVWGGRDHYAWTIYDDGGINYDYVIGKNCVRPLIYLR